MHACMVRMHAMQMYAVIWKSRLECKDPKLDRASINVSVSIWGEAYYACMHIVHACTFCMLTMHAYILCMHAYYACMHNMHA